MVEVFGNWILSLLNIRDGVIVVIDDFERVKWNVSWWNEKKWK